jgi:hypothetical protein
MYMYNLSNYSLSDTPTEWNRNDPRISTDLSHFLSPNSLVTDIRRGPCEVTDVRMAWHVVGTG